jgi:hypothetical protein
MFFVHKYSWLLLLFLLNAKAWGSDSTKQNNLFHPGFRLHYGFIIPHSKSIQPISGSNPYGADIDFAWLLMSDRALNRCNCNSLSGFSLSYYNFGNEDILGSAWNLSAFYEPFLVSNRYFRISFKNGIGLTYLTTTYDPKTNPKNLFFGSHLSFLLFTQLQTYIRLSGNHLLNAGFCYNHISNGGISAPNKGMNFPTFSLGIIFSPYEPKKLNHKTFSRDSKHKNKRFNLDIFGSLRKVTDNDYQNEELVPIIGFSGSYSSELSKFYAWRRGIEMIYERNSGEDLILQDKNPVLFSAAIFLGHELLVGKFIFGQNINFLLISPDAPKIYERYYLYYKMSNKLYAGVSLKAHLHVADIFDFRFMYSF